MTNQRSTMEVSFGTIIKFLAIILGLVLAYLIRDVIAIAFFALIIASVVSRPVNWLKKYHIPKTLSVLMIYIFIVAIFVVLIAIIVTPLAYELKQFAEFIPIINSKLDSGIQFFRNFANSQGQLQQFFSTLSEKISQFGVSVFSLTGNFVGTITSFIIVFILSFYLSIENEGVKKFIRSIVPVDKKDYVANLWERGQKKLSHWFGSQLLLGLIVGLMTFVGLTILRMPYALALSIMAGLFELVPTVGPILSAIPAVLIAFIKSPLLALITLALYIIIQQLENHLLVPKIMQKTTGLNPVITILALLIGVKLAGIVGMILAIPVTMLLSEFSQDIFRGSRFEKNKPSQNNE